MMTRGLVLALVMATGCTVDAQFTDTEIMVCRHLAGELPDMRFDPMAPSSKVRAGIGTGHQLSFVDMNSGRYMRFTSDVQEWDCAPDADGGEK